MEPLITTIITTYRRPHLLKKAIESVLSQTYSHFQVWICDNASHDGTSEIVNEFVKNDERVKYFCHETNIGMLNNYQFGLSLVNTEFFSFLSDDDVLLPNFYDTALLEFKKYPEAGLVAGSTIIMTEKGEVVRIPLSFWTREGKFDPPEGVIEMIGKYPVPTSVLFRKTVLEHAAIDFENPTYWDCDYLLQIAAALPIVIYKEPCALFRQHDHSYSNHQNLSYYEDAYGKLIKKIQKNKNLTDEKSEIATNLVLTDLAHCRTHYFNQSLKKKQFNEAYKIVLALRQHPSFRKRATFYLYIVKLCKLLPLAYYGLLLVRNLKRWTRKKDMKNPINKNYASKL
jgi:glycosyltransferase involved in cell wall biosynthesis